MFTLPNVNSNKETYSQRVKHSEDLIKSELRLVKPVRCSDIEGSPENVTSCSDYQRHPVFERPLSDSEVLQPVILPVQGNSLLSNNDGRLAGFWVDRNAPKCFLERGKLILGKFLLCIFDLLLQLPSRLIVPIAVIFGVGVLPDNLWHVAERRHNSATALLFLDNCV